MYGRYGSSFWIICHLLALCIRVLWKYCTGGREKSPVSLHIQQSLQVRKRTIKDIQIDFLINTWQCTHIGMLPEFPFPLIANGIHIIMGNPIRIGIENRIVQILGLELIGSINDRLHSIVTLHLPKPNLQIVL